MRKIVLAGALLVGVLTAGSPMARAQDAPTHSSRFQLESADAALTYMTEQGSVTPGGGNYWLQGASLDTSITFAHRFGLAANLMGGEAHGIAPGVNLRTLSFMAGPRYTYGFHMHSKHSPRMFGEVLAGAVKDTDGVFPTSAGLSDSDTSFSWMGGGGVDVPFSKHLAIRAEGDYVRTYLPNNGTNVQDNFRVAIGVTYHYGKP